MMNMSQLEASLRQAEQRLIQQEYLIRVLEARLAAATQQVLTVPAGGG